jgi:hypothetical protein
MSLNKEVMLCVHLILLPSIGPPLASTGCSPCSSYPPYNIARTGENAYRISVAVAGFTDADLSIEAKENTLTLRGEKQTKDEEKSGDLLYRGIVARNFERNFQSRPCSGQGCEPGERAPAHRPRTRDPGGDEASGDPDHDSRKVLQVKPTKVAA